MNSVFAKMLYTGKEVLSDRYVAFDGTTISEVTEEETGDVIGRYDVVMPAFIDPHSHIGMNRCNEPSNYTESNDRLLPIQAVVDALDSLQMDDPAFERAIEMGVLYSCIVPGSANIVGGMSAVIRNYAPNSTKALIDRAGMKMAFGWNTITQQGKEGERPNTRMGTFAVLRRASYEVLDKAERNERLTREEQVLHQILKGELRVRAHCHRVDDIASLLRFVDEFGVQMTLEHAGDVDDIDTFRDLKERGIAVTYGPLGGCARKLELRNRTWQNVVPLMESGVDFALMTDHPVSWAHDLFNVTRYFLRAGMSRQGAVELITRRNAEQIGVDDRLGTLEPGKWASCVCWDSDPFDLASAPAAVYGEGEVRFSREGV